VQAMVGDNVGPLGAVRVAYAPHGTSSSSSSVTIETAAVVATLKTLRENALVLQERGELLQLAPDTHIWMSDVLYLIRPLAEGRWLERTARQVSAFFVQDGSMLRPLQPGEAA